MPDLSGALVLGDPGVPIVDKKGFEIAFVNPSVNPGVNPFVQAFVNPSVNPFVNPVVN